MRKKEIKTMVGQERTPVESDAGAPQAESSAGASEQTEGIRGPTGAVQQAGAREGQSSGAGRYLILLGILVIAVLAAYGLGGWQERRAALSVHQSFTSDVERLQMQVADLRGEVLTLEARRQLHIALMALDRRNFGTAQRYLVAAGKDLASIKRAPAGSDPAVLSRLAQELQSARLVATEDFGRHRDRILGWVNELDGQFPKELAETVPPTAEPGANQPPAEATGRTGTAVEPSVPGEAPQSPGVAGENPVAAGAAPGEGGQTPGTPATPGPDAGPAGGAPASPITSPQPAPGTPGTGGTGPGAGATFSGEAPTPATPGVPPARTGGSR
jgi:hypothetical protein